MQLPVSGNCILTYDSLINNLGCSFYKFAIAVVLLIVCLIFVLSVCSDCKFKRYFQIFNKLHIKLVDINKLLQKYCCRSDQSEQLRICAETDKLDSSLIQPYQQSVAPDMTFLIKSKGIMRRFYIKSKGIDKVTMLLSNC